MTSDNLKGLFDSISAGESKEFRRARVNAVALEFPVQSPPRPDERQRFMDKVLARYVGDAPMKEGDK